jgi:hypothetical protein
VRGHEAPGAVLRGPPITVTCDCGRSGSPAYGERWTCDGCGRTFDTARIPRDEYEAVRRMTLRFRALPVALGAAVVALAVLFTSTGNVGGVFFLLPAALLGWFSILRPVHRRRYRAGLRDLPHWDLRAD